MKFDSQLYRYPSRRTVTYANRGMVCTSAPLAAQAGLEVMRKGGNAIDAAVATAIALTVAEPCSNGLGSDAFALVWTGGKLYGLNASGWAPEALSASLLRQKGMEAVPTRGWEPVMTPGAPAGWAEMIQRFGRLGMEEVAEPAAYLAEKGYPVSPTVAYFWGKAANAYAKANKGPQFDNWFTTFAPVGKAPEAGDLWRCPEMASTIREIAATNAESYYRGSLAEKIVRFSQQTGGYFSVGDFADYNCEWVEPITINYKGYDVYEIPPNGQGITALMALNILKGMELGAEKESLRTYHAMIEAIKLAFVDAKAFVADPRHMKTKVSDMLSNAYADARRALIRPEAAIYPEAGNPFGGDTVYLCTADGEGNMVSFIQSNYGGFGSGIVVPETGISLQNRGSGFSMDENSDNCIAGRKKSYHTIIPGFLAKDGKPVGPFGVMGGFMQPQGHMQVVVNTVDYGMNPQEAIDAPRFQWTGEKKIQIDAGVPMDIIQRLADMGHQISINHNIGTMGRGEIIWRMENGVLAGGSESRADGTVAAY